MGTKKTGIVLSIPSFLCALTRKAGVRRISRINVPMSPCLPKRHASNELVCAPSRRPPPWSTVQQTLSRCGVYERSVRSLDNIGTSVERSVPEAPRRAKRSHRRDKGSHPLRLTTSPTMLCPWRA